MNRVRPKTPFWVMRTAQLRGVAKKLGVKIFKGSTFSLFFVDMGEVVSSIKVRPLFIREEEGGYVWGKFDLFDPYTNERIPLNLPYHRPIEGFVYEIPGEHAVLATSYPGLDYYEDEDREKFTKLFQEIEEPAKEKKPCRKTKKLSTPLSASERSFYLEVEEPSEPVVRTLFSE